MLAENYNPKLHATQLANCCFRCHHPQLVAAYNEFRLKVQPDLSEPRMSAVYANEQFVDMRSLGRNKADKTLIIPDPFIEPIPKNLGDILDEVF